MLGGAKIGVVIGLMTFAATLFSTFTLLGMPDFSRANGVGAWIFLAFSDAIMVFLILWFGLYLRKRVGKSPYQGMSVLLQKCYQNRMVGYLYFTAVFLFSSLTSLFKSEGWPYFWFLLFRILFPFGAGLLGSF